MKAHSSCFIGLACLLGVSCVSAATLIEQRDQESTTIMYVDGVQMRVQAPADQSYVLMNLGEKTYFVVNPDEKMVMDMTETVWSLQNSKSKDDKAKVNASLDKAGAGPTIAGYETEHFILKANGRYCQDLFVSREAFDDSGLDEVWAEYGQNMKEMGVDSDDACDIAEIKVFDPGKHGWPLKTMYKKGEHAGQFEEVLRIEQGVDLPAGGFVVPDGYRVVSMQEMMGGMNFDIGGNEEYDEEAEDEEELEGKIKGFMNPFKKDKKDDNG